MIGTPVVRCTGGRFCAHAPGTCTATIDRVPTPDARQPEVPAIDELFGWFRDKPDLRAMAESVAEAAYLQGREQSIPSITRYAAALAIYRSYREDAELERLRREVEELRKRLIDQASLTPMTVYITKPAESD